MAKIKMLLSKDGLKSVAADKIREIDIYEDNRWEKPIWIVRGWFNLNENFEFGEFDSKEEAVKFRNKILGIKY